MNSDNRIVQFDEKPMAAASHTISCGIYVIRRRQLIERIDRVQTFVTCTDLSDLAGAKQGAVYRVEKGELKRIWAAFGKKEKILSKWEKSGWSAGYPQFSTSCPQNP